MKRINEWKNGVRKNSLNLKKYEGRRGIVTNIGCQMRQTGK
jgi:hypothetical protein